MSSELGAAGSGGRDAARTGGGRGQRSVMAWQVLSALFLLTMGGIHLYLVFHGVGGMLGVLFVLNAVGALVLAIAMVVLRRRLRCWQGHLACCSWRARCLHWCSR